MLVPTIELETDEAAVGIVLGALVVSACACQDHETWRVWCWGFGGISVLICVRRRTTGRGGKEIAAVDAQLGLGANHIDRPGKIDGLQLSYC